MKILVIEDDHKIATGIKKGLEQEGNTVDLAFDGEEGLDLAMEENSDVIVLDLMLPKMNGIEVAKSLRKDNIHTPVLMLTAKGELSDKLIGFETGADDYLVKPFAFEELIARINAIARRPKEVKSEKIKVEKISGNEAKKLAVQMQDKIIAFVSSSHMVGATHVVNNQLNENAKVFSTDYQIPEINHHLMEGLSHPEANKTALFAIFVNSSLYPNRIQQRFALTEEVVKKHDVEVFEYKAKAKNELSQNFEFIQFGAYVNLYLSILYKQDPGSLPWVDFFKNKLGQPLGK